MTDTVERASHLLDVGRVDEARRLLLEHPETPTDGRALVALARCHHRSGDRKAAVEAARSASAVAPTHPGAWLILALGLLALEGPIAALEPARRGLALAPDHPGSHEIMAQVLAGLGRFDAATTHAARAQALAPHEPGGWIAQARVELARHRGMGAVICCERALERDPTDEEARILLGVAQAATGGVDGRHRGMATLSGALRERPDADHVRRVLRTVALGTGPSPPILFALVLLAFMTRGVTLVVPVAVLTASAWERWSTVPADVRRFVLADRGTRLRIRAAMVALAVAWVVGVWLLVTTILAAGAGAEPGGSARIGSTAEPAPTLGSR